jgi:hypothetical protein
MPNPPSEEELQQTLRNYLENWAKENLPDFNELSEDTSAETLEEITKSLEQLADTEFEAITQDATGEFIDAIEATFQDWAKTAREELDPEGAGNQVIYKAMLNFFEADEWPLIEDEDEPILYMNFQGENGQWHCLAKVREAEDQCVFYSLYPEAIPEDKRSILAEFLTRANYGMILGNFELDFDDGEIRYKTSIDVEGDRLTPTLVQNLVYTNVMTMDQYLPGILAILEQNLTAKDALDLVEKQLETNEQPSSSER